MNYRIPLDEIIDYKGNIYKMSALAIKEAVRLSKENPEDLKKDYGDSKIAAIALSKAFSNDIKYTDNCEKTQTEGRKK